MRRSVRVGRAALSQHRNAPGAARADSALQAILFRDVLPTLGQTSIAIANAVTRVADASLRPDATFEAAFQSACRLVDGSTERVMLDVLAPAARHLGALWLEDRLGFCDVTVGIMRLDRALRAVARPGGPAPGARRIALWTVPGDTHRFGTAMLAAIFRGRGWNVLSTRLADASSVGSQVENWGPGIVGFSIGDERCVDALRACIAAARDAGCPVLVGGPLLLERPDLASAFGADATATHADAALRLADALACGLPASGLTSAGAGRARASTAAEWAG